MQIFPRQRAVGDNADVARPVADFPRFADGRARRQIFFVKPFEVAPAPDAFLEDGMKGERIEHCGLRGRSSRGGGGAVRGRLGLFRRSWDFFEEMPMRPVFFVTLFQPLGDRQREEFVEVFEQMRF